MKALKLSCLKHSFSGEQSSCKKTPCLLEHAISGDNILEKCTKAHKETADQPCSHSQRLECLQLSLLRLLLAAPHCSWRCEHHLAGLAQASQLPAPHFGPCLTLNLL